MSFRLTLWYTVLFSVSALVAFLIVFLLIRSVIFERQDHALLVELKEFSLIQKAGGLSKLKEGLKWEAASEGANQIFLRIFSNTGEELLSTDMSAWQSVYQASHSLDRLTSAGGDYVFETISTPGQTYPARVVCGFIGNGLILQFGKSFEEDEVFLAIFSDVFEITMVGVTLIAALSGWFMARRALSGVEEVTRTALQISTGSFEQRVAVKSRGAEIELLATTFNKMLDQINAVFKNMKEINNSIAHDLRSPLARVRGAAEMALTTATNVDENRAIAAGIMEDCDRLLAMINTMLDIAESESGVLKPKSDRVDIASVIMQATDLFMPVAETGSIKISTELSEGCIVIADSKMLQRMVGNLLDNALKFTPPGGSVKITTVAEKESIIIMVRDSGIGIYEKDLSHIFEKFYRCDSSRSRKGSGLGLSLVKAIAELHGGSITVRSIPGHGSVFNVTLPRVPV